MISTWSEWKRYPRLGRGENIEAPISPGLYEVRYAGTGALHSFEAVDNVAQALALLQTGARRWRCCRPAPSPGSAAATRGRKPTSNTGPARPRPKRTPRPRPNA
ncbi:hypothetical protein ACVIGB_006210 [Bradyrhizobium sp. USDA 4341]